LPERRGILITRPEPDASETAALVARLGFDPVVAPVLKITPGAVAPGVPVDAVLVTSRNALPSLLEGYRPVRLLTVGRATAARAESCGFTDVLDADGDAADLALLARRVLKPGARLLVAHGRGQGGALMGDLRRLGFRVRGRRAYAAVPAPRLPQPAASALREGSLRAAMFLSAETARVFVRLLPDRLRPLVAEVDAVAIGQAAASALAPLPWHRVRVSLKPTLDQVLALL
jgi:uroporphyrinogen-III synthase